MPSSFSVEGDAISQVTEVVNQKNKKHGLKIKKQNSREENDPASQFMIKSG